MTTKAVRYTQPLLGAVPGTDTLLQVDEVAEVLIRQAGVACTVYGSNDKAALANPVTRGVAPGDPGLSTRGELLVYLEAGRGYDAVVTVGAGSEAVVTVVTLPDVSPDVDDAGVQADIVTETPGATVALDLSDGRTRRYVTLEEDTALAVANDDDQPVFLVIVDTGDGGFDLTFWDGIQWATEGGAAPTVTPEAEARDVFSFIKLGTLDYLGFVVGQGLAIPVAVTVPDVPTGITAVAGNTTADVSFTPGDDGGAARDGCRITPFIGATAQTPQVFATTATTQTLTGLTNSTTYTFKVEDHNAEGYSAPLSAASNSVTPIDTTPLYPALDLYPSLSLYPAA